MKNRSLRSALLAFGGLALLGLSACADTLDLTDLDWQPWKKSSEQVRGADAGSWKFTPATWRGVDLSLQEMPVRDWTKFRRFKFWAYSEKPTSTVITIQVPAGEKSEAANYFVKKFAVDWKGWKQFNFPLEEFKLVRNPTWNAVQSLRFSGWSEGAPEEGTVLYFSGLVLE